jgi:hypothetical protein
MEALFAELKKQIGVRRLRLWRQNLLAAVPPGSDGTEN